MLDPINVYVSLFKSKEYKLRKKKKKTSPKRHIKLIEGMACINVTITNLYITIVTANETSIQANG